MPSKDQNVSGSDADPEVTQDGPSPSEDRPRESKPRRSKSDTKSDKDREKRSHRSSKSSGRRAEGSQVSSTRKHKKRDKDKDRDADDGKDRRFSASDLLSGVSSVGRDHRISLPYPSFSKAHSKESVASRDSLSLKKKTEALTPDTTDLGGSDKKTKSASSPGRSSSTTKKKTSRPPSPPETDLSADKRRRENELREAELERPKSRASDGSQRTASKRDDESKVSRRSASSSQATYIKNPTHRSHDRILSDSRPSSRQSMKRSSSTRSTKTKKLDTLEVESSPSSAQDSSPKTPTAHGRFSPNLYGGNPSSSQVQDQEEDDDDVVDVEIPSKTATPASAIPMPPPPPPPPPAMDFHEIPRVDYLLQNGGLAYPAPKTFLSVLPRQNFTRPSNPPLVGAETLFAPFFNLLEQFNTVINKQGSVAVATGHRSVARRLLDRLENVFSRDLPPHGCYCVMCEKSHEVHRGLTWGDVLEWVSGRLDLPQWPPFDLAEIGTKAAEVSAEAPARPASPVKMDPDIAEEFREHYLRQTKKVRSAVDKWLTGTGETPAPPPQDVDDETLNFAILTNLDPEDRPYLNALLSGARELKPANRAPTPMYKSRNDFVVKAGLSLQRLYRLQTAPRDAEAAAYLVKNPHTHDLLVTISNINNSEWEILTSGRFDGFLWSGADADEHPGWESRGPTPAFSPGSRAPSAMSMRGQTPYSVSRGATPSSFISGTSSAMPGSRAPVSNDEETEMAVIAEIERDIFQGMESLEDAFEKLHVRAEVVRNALRQRGAGLMQSFQNRRRIDVLSTPGPGGGTAASTPFERGGWGDFSEMDGSDSEWGGMDDVDITPDDSASNVSSSRHRRPKRRVERRTPAPIEEDADER